MPPLHSPSYPYPRSTGLCSPPQTLAPVPRIPIDAARPSSAAAIESLSPVSLSPIPCTGSFSAPSSTDSAPKATSSLAASGRRRSPWSAAAQRRRAARPLPLLARVTAGEARRSPLHAVRTFPGRLWPCFAALPRAAAARRRCARRVRAHRASPATPWPRPRRGQGACPALTRLGGPLASGPHPSVPAGVKSGCI